MARQHRGEGEQQQRRHGQIEGAQGGRAIQPAAHAHAERRPDRHRRRVDDHEDEGDQGHIGRQMIRRRIGRDRADRHRPGLGIDPLEGCGLQERHGLCARLALTDA